MALARVCALLVVFGSAPCDAIRAKSDSRGVGSNAKSQWQVYLQDQVAEAKWAVGGQGLQAGCVPEMHEATGPYKGAILLFHGFTACPQQFDRLIPLLTSKGYTVFAPTTPGHGYEYKLDWLGNGKDYIKDMPYQGEEYRVFARKMHDIMMSANGQKVVFGHSLGGGIAAYTGYLGGYDRVMLAAPMIFVAGIMNTAITLAKLHSDMKHKEFSWGPSCEKERKMGRAGGCHFDPTIGTAARNVGQMHLYDAQRNGGKFKFGGMQMVFVQDDTAVSMNAVTNLGLKYGLTHDSPMICGMDKELGHSFLSPYDNPTQDKYWLDEVTHMVADYLADGKLLPQGGGTRGDNFPRCDVKSTPR